MNNKLILILVLQLLFCKPSLHTRLEECPEIGIEIFTSFRTTPPQTTPGPFQFVASSGTYSADSLITVEISTRDVFSFCCFAVQAHDSETHEPIGSWIQTPHIKYAPQCNAVANTDPRDKKNISLTWKAPSDGSQNKNVYFRGIIMQRFSIYWMENAKVAKHQ